MQQKILFGCFVGTLPTGAHALVECGVQPIGGASIWDIEGRFGYTSQGRKVVAGKKKRGVECERTHIPHLWVWASELKRVLGQEKKREQLRQRGWVMGQIWAASIGHAWDVLCSKGRPNSGHIQQLSRGQFQGAFSKEEAKSEPNLLSQPEVVHRP
jgi:hypothetical protein